MNHTHRIRRDHSNKRLWCLVALLDDGTTEDLHSKTTARDLDTLLRLSGGLLPMPDDSVQIVYYSPEPGS